MPDSIAGLLEKADLAVAAASLLADDSITAPIARAASMLRRRLDYPEDLLLVGFAGGTGSGKSSLVNAIAGSEVAVVGGLRPTTDRPLAVLSARSSRQVRGYFNDLGVEDVASTEMPDWLCLIDLPDTDSVELGHRLQVETLVPHLDVIVWVVDPEKYRDSSLHHDYLRPLLAHSGRFLFVLNQADRLSGETRTMVLSDFHRALVDDGMESPTVRPTAAAPRSGPPSGIVELIDELRSRRSSGVIARALVDLQETASSLIGALGPSNLDYEARASAVTEEVTRAIVMNKENEASDRLVAFVEGLSNEVGAVTGQRLRSAAARVPIEIQQLVEDVRGKPDGGATAPGVGNLSDKVGDAAWGAAISDRVLGQVREILRARASALALVTDLSISAAAVRTRMGV